jgi:hypothetical protein
MNEGQQVISIERDPLRAYPMHSISEQNALRTCSETISEHYSRCPTKASFLERKQKTPLSRLRKRRFSGLSAS